ncbi:MAG: DUF3391 domain-containing protein [Cycloclasticus sp.]
MIDWILKLFRKKVPTAQATKGILESELTYVRTDNLAMGMYVAQLDRPWIESPFKLQGFNIKTE